MDSFVALRQKVKDSFPPKVARRTPPKGPRAYETGKRVPDDAISTRFANLSISPPTLNGASSTPPRTHEVMLKPALPKAITIDAGKVLTYIRDHSDLSLLFLDLRTRDEFDIAHIDHPNVVCIDPLVCRKDANSQDIEDAFVVGPPDELALFEARDRYDLIIIYDRGSMGFNRADAAPDNAYPDALQNLQIALWEKSNWKKPLARSPVLLLGGLQAWTRSGGPSTSTISSDSEERRSSTGASLIVQQPHYASPDVSTKQKHRGTSIVQADDPPMPYARSAHEYISGSLAKHQSINTAFHRPLGVRNGPRFADSSVSPIIAKSLAKPAQLQLTSAESVSPKSSPYLESPDFENPVQRNGLPSYARQPSLGNQVSRLGQTTIGKTGLKNLGNSCFMNAVLQCLAACFPLARYFTSGHWKADVRPDNPLGYKGQVALQFANLLRELISDDNSVVAPVDLRTVLGRSRPEFAKGNQQDAQELMNFLLDALHEDLNANGTKPQLRALTEEEEFHRETLTDAFVSSTEWDRYVHRNMSIIVKLFQGQLQSRLKCSHSNNTSTTNKAFTTLTHPNPLQKPAVSLIDCVEEFVKPEAMENDDSWFCAKCRTKRTASKKLTISKLPDVLLIHFKRFQSKGPWRDKLNTNISFPLSGLDMTTFLNAPSKSVYDLFGIVYHRGSMEGGHYTAIINPDSSRSASWTLFDDSRVAPTSGIDGKAAYLLFYAKRADMM